MRKTGHTYATVVHLHGLSLVGNRAWNYSFPLHIAHSASLGIYLEYVSSVHLIGIV